MNVKIGQTYKQKNSENKGKYVQSIRYKVTEINGQTVCLTVVEPVSCTKNTYAFMKSQLDGFVELVD